MSTVSPRSDGGTWKRIPSHRCTMATSVRPAATSATASHGSTSCTTTSRSGALRASSASRGGTTPRTAVENAARRSSPDGRPGVALQPGAQPLHLLAEHPPLVDEPATGRGEHHPAPGALEQGGPDLPLEPLDLLGDRRRGEAELGGRAADAAAALDGDE